MADEIGRAKIIVEADTEGVKASISDAKAEVENLGDAGESAGAKIGAGFESVGAKIEGSTAGVRKFTGAISSAVGSMTSMVGVVTSVIGVLLLLSKTFTNAKDRGKEFGKEINSIRDSIAGISVDETLSFEEQQRRRRMDAEDQIREAKHLSAEKKRMLIEEAREAEFQSLQTRKRLEREAESQRLRDQEEMLLFIQDAANKQKAEDRKRMHDRMVAEDLAIAAAEKREIESANRVAKAAADAMERAMAPLIASLTSSFGTDFTTQLSGITSKIDDAVAELRKVKRGR